MSKKISFTASYKLVTASSECQIAAEYGRGISKELVAIYTVEGGVLGYEVRSHDKVTLTTRNLAYAVAAYNELR